MPQPIASALQAFINQFAADDHHAAFLMSHHDRAAQVKRRAEGAFLRKKPTKAQTTFTLIKKSIQYICFSNNFT